MAPTTMLDQKTTTSPFGRRPSVEGYPMRIAELLADLDGTTYLERVAITDPKHIKRAKKAIKNAFQCQIDELGFSLIEILSACPTNWKMNAIESCDYITNVMAKSFPIGVIKDMREERSDQ